MDVFPTSANSASSPSNSEGSHGASPDERLPETEAQDALTDFEIDQILYCSLLSEPMSEAAISQLALTATNLNRLDHITGMLMHADGVFVQLIEGPPHAVNHLWARLLRDPRHKGVVQLYHYRELEQRTCQDWGMKLVDFQTLQSIVHKASQEVQTGKHTVWAKAIERMDFLLSHSQWDHFVADLKMPR